MNTIEVIYIRNVTMGKHQSGLERRYFVYIRVLEGGEPSVGIASLVEEVG